MPTLKFIYWAVSLSSCLLFGCATQQEQCREPEHYGHIDSRSYSNIIRQQSYSILPMTSFSITDDRSIVPQRFINISYAYLVGHLTCPNKNNGQHRDLNGHARHNHRTNPFYYYNNVDNLNLCPVRKVKNIDVNRHPSTIIESECACPAPTDGSDLSCYPVTQYIKVYRRVGCEQNEVYVYELVWEPVRVACVAGHKISTASLNNRRIMPE